MNVADAQGFTPFRQAAEYGLAPLLHLLHTAGADLSLESAWIPLRHWPPAIASDSVLCDWLAEAYEVKVRPLTHLCKFVIRSSVGPNISEKIYALPLPHAVRQFCVSLSDLP